MGSKNLYSLQQFLKKLERRYKEEKKVKIFLKYDLLFESISLQVNKLNQ